MTACLLSDEEVLDAFFFHRCQALWCHSEEAQARLNEILLIHACPDPRHATDEAKIAISIEFFDIDGDFPDVAGAAHRVCAAWIGRRVAQLGGQKRQLKILCDRWLSPEFHQDAEQAFGRGV